MRASVILLVLATMGASAQPVESAPEPPLFATAGAGMSGTGTEASPAFVTASLGATAALLSSYDALHVGASAATGVELLRASDVFREVHVAYGARLSGPVGTASVVAGPSLVQARRSVAPDARVETLRVGAYLGAQGVVGVGEGAGVGVEVFSHISPGLTTVGVRLLVAAGRF